MAQCVYICSAGHSGSTLLDLLLGSHSNIMSLGEISHLPKNLSLNNLCTCGVPVLVCPFWKEVIGRLSERMGINIWDSPYLLNLGLIDPVVVKDERHKSRWYKFKRKVFMGLNYVRLVTGSPLLANLVRSIATNPQNNFLLYEEVLKVSGKEIIVDSTKIYQKGIDLYRLRPGEVRIVLLSRDGRGVLYSNLKRKICSRSVAVAAWRRYYERTFKLIEKYVSPEHVLRVKYEDLAQRPIDELKRLCAFLGQTYEDTMLNFIDCEQHITNGNNMRFASSSEIRFDESWKTGLSADDLKFFESEAGALNRKLGHTQ